MRKKITLYYICLLLAVSAAFAQTAQSGRHVRIKPQDYQARLGTGLDVDWSKTDAGRQTYSRKSARDIKDRGFSHVRIRIRDDAGQPLFDSLDEQIRDCLSVGLLPIIAYQADEFKNTVSAEALNQAVNWWRTVAERYKDYPPELSFDLIIEVTDALNDRQDILNEFYGKAVPAIRETNAKRIIFMSPRVRSAPEYLQELQIPESHNGYLMAEWHFYAAGPSKTNPKKQWTTGTKAERKRIRDKIRLAKAFQRETGILTWVGAWMPGNYNDGNDYTIAEQTVFAAFVAGQLRQAGIPYAVNSDEKYYDREQKVWKPEMEPVVDAVLGRTRQQTAP